MKIVYIGAVDTSVSHLEAVIKSEGNVVAIFTLPEELGKRRHSNFADLTPLAKKLNIPIRKQLRRSGAISRMQFLFGAGRKLFQKN